MTQLTFTILVCAGLLAVINFPFVIGVEKYIATHNVKLVYGVAAPEGQRVREIRNALTTTPVHALLFMAFIWSGWLVIGEETAFLIITTFVGTLLWTEVWHYFSHRAMHLRIIHFLHREHHRSRVTGVWSSVSFSFLEKFIFSAGILGGLAAISQAHSVSAIGITAYYVMYFFTNTLGHANFEFRKPDYRSSVMGKIFNSPSYHAMHHARYDLNYGLLTPWLDQILGTEWKDAPNVQTSAAMGHPLKTLSERL
jgi:Delta7-sterol 5-desaturase